MSDLEYRECVCGTIYHATRAYKDKPDWMDYYLPGSLQVHDHCVDCDAELMYLSDSMPVNDLPKPALKTGQTLYEQYKGSDFGNFYDELYGDEPQYWDLPPIAQRGCHAKLSQPRRYVDPR